MICDTSGAPAKEYIAFVIAEPVNDEMSTDSSDKQSWNKPYMLVTRAALIPDKSMLLIDEHSLNMELILVTFDASTPWKFTVFKAAHSVNMHPMSVT